MIRAAFIGIDRYQDAGIKDLSGAVRDATALWAVLSDSIEGLTGTLVTDAAATCSAVIQLLDETLGAAEEDDIVLLSFAGHGTTDHRLVFADSKADDLPGSTLDMGELAQRFRSTRARTVILLLDCCFSGGAPARVLDIGLVARSPIVPLTEIAGQGRIILAASAPDQEALEDPETRHGLFTKAVLDCLLNSDQSISIFDLIDQVIQLVQTRAGVFGYKQTPVMFGHVEGSLNLPSGKKGENYRRAFPEWNSIKVTSNIADLASFNLPEPVINAWQARFSEGLNPLQLSAVNDYSVLGGESLLVVAPTSAGKTFVGEMCALKAIMEGRKAVFLLPFKALVNEKYEDFQSLYGEQLGLRIARCSGDWSDQISDVLFGKYDIAFFTYEKFLGLCVSSPYLLNQIGLVVLDEAHFITDAERGIVVELLLTSLVSARQRGVSPQLIALSAVIGGTNSLELWLGCGLLQTTERPVPLTEGVLDRAGTYRFITPAGEVQSAQLLDRWAIQQRRTDPSSQDVIVPLVRHLIAAGEKVIVFRNNRGAASGCAEYLARELGLPPAHAVIDELPEHDLSAMSGRLRSALSGGVAFHHGDLNREERIAVERGFRQAAGGIHVLVATSTVAAGINTPASTVVIVENGFRGAEFKPYTVAQYKNMAGRAGRLGFEAEGKSILLAETGFEGPQLFRTYVQGRPEPMKSSLNIHDPGTWIIRLLAQVGSVPREAAVDLLANTYGGFLAGLKNPKWRHEVADRLASLLNRMIQDGLIEQRDELLTLTMLGRACGESPMSLESALQLVELIRRLQPEQATLETLLSLVEALPERDNDYTPQNRRGEAGWQQNAMTRLGPEIVRLLRSRAPSDIVYYARCKRALIVRDWIDGVPTAEIEERYSSNAYSRVGHGDIRGFADGTRFLLDSVFRIAAILLERAEQPEDVTRLLKRLDLGVPVEALDFAELPMTLDRGEMLGLLQAGYISAESVANLHPDELERIIGKRRARLLHQRLNPVSVE